MKNPTTIATALINEFGQVEFCLNPEFKIMGINATIITIGQVTNEVYSRLPNSYPSSRDVLVQVSIEDLQKTQKIKIVTSKSHDADIYSIDFWPNGERRGTGNEINLGVISHINQTVVMTVEQYLKIVNFLSNQL